MPPKISPPLSPQQLLAQCCWPAPPPPPPAPSAPPHPAPPPPPPLPPLPPSLPPPFANGGPGVGEGHPSAFVPARQAQAPRSYR